MWLACLISVPVGNGAEIPKAPVPKSPYIAVVYRYADTLLEKGRDTYGPQQTGLFLSALDRATLAPLTNRPTAPAGIPDRVRAGAKDGPLVGANPQHDENLLRLLYLLTELTTKTKYREGADASLKQFFLKARSPATGLLPWAWDTINDQEIKTAGNDCSEFVRPWMLWNRCFDLAPDASKGIVLGLAKCKGLGSLRQAGFDLRMMAEAYARTKDQQFLDAIEESLRHLELNKAKDGNAPPAAGLSLAIDCDGAAHSVPEPLASRLREAAARHDEIFSSLQYELKHTGAFIDGEERLPGKTSLWNARYGSRTTAQVGLLCVSRYDNTGKTTFRNLLIAAADAYLDSLPSDGEDIWPGTFGHAISLQIAAWRHSAKPAYFERARKFADIAIERFFGTNALPRASLKSEHYESITGADTLALALAELHLQVLHITAVRCPPNTIDR